MKLKAVIPRLRYAGASVFLFLAGCSTEVLNPKGDIGAQEKSLILIALGLMAVVAVPVIVMTLVFAWRYRAGNKKARYAPNWSHSTAIEVVVWSVPAVIIAILATITWRTSHTLDPYKPLDSKAKPVTIEAVALDWKWLFIYPDQGIATVNQIAFPTDVPVNFHITSDSVMNAFFIPQLGSQIYAMAGMETQLHLIAREPGTYAGLSSNYSGAGFSDMHFQAIATSQQGFDAWVAKVKSQATTLDSSTYDALAKPSEKNPVTYYSHVSPGLFAGVIGKYMGDTPLGGQCAGTQTQVAALPSNLKHAKAAE
ncbi:MAG: ubiquinol oxidase subunit II [Pseudomonadota bacterium]